VPLPAGKPVAHSFPRGEVIPRIAPPHPRATAPDIVFQSPAGNLARWLRPSIGSFPRHNGYLVADPERIAHRETKHLSALGSGLKVGISWRSSVMTNRVALKPIPGSRNGNRFSGFRASRSSTCSTANAKRDWDKRSSNSALLIHRWNDFDLKNDLDEVAALSMALDLVVSSPSVVSTYPERWESRSGCCIYAT